MNIDDLNNYDLENGWSDPADGFETYKELEEWLED